MSGVLSYRLRIAAGVAAAAALALTIPAVAQQPTFRASTQVVSLFATVLDAQNRLVPELTKEEDARVPAA